MADTYSINGTNLSTLMVVNKVEGGIGAPTVLQDDYLVPGRTGAIATNPWIGPAPLVIYGTVIGTSRSDFITKCRTLVRTLFNNGKPSTITRNVTGAPTATASVRYVSGLESIEELSDKVGRVAVEFTMLSGVWSDESFTESSTQSGTTFSLTVPGDTFTPQLVVEYSGGTGQKLTNTTTGEFVELDALVTSGTAVVVDVVNYTATRGTVNVVSSVKTGPLTSGAYWLTLVPGVNKFTLAGGGSVKLKYKGAYL